MTIHEQINRRLLVSGAIILLGFVFIWAVSELYYALPSEADWPYWIGVIVVVAGFIHAAFVARCPTCGLPAAAIGSRYAPSNFCPSCGQDFNAPAGKP